MYPGLEPLRFWSAFSSVGCYILRKISQWYQNFKYFTAKYVLLQIIIVLEINTALGDFRLDIVHHNWTLCGVWIDPLLERDGHAENKFVRQNCLRVIKPVSLVYGGKLGHICINRWIRRWAAMKVKCFPLHFLMIQFF